MNRILHIAAALALIGCGGPATGDPDAGRIDGSSARCELPPGKSYVVTRLNLAPPEDPVAADLDGDSAVDNELGNLPAGARAEINAGMDDSVASGEMIWLVHLTDWTDPPSLDDDTVVMHVFTGADADTPEDPSNNGSGTGRFIAEEDLFDLDCNSRTGSEDGRIEAGVLTARRSAWRVPLTTATGSVEFSRTTVIVDLDSEFARGEGTVTFALDLCSLSAVPFPGTIQGTFLDALINDPLLSSSASPDMDFDGDGLEQVIGDGVTIARCIDGDGTAIEGRSCPCHPNMADAYSAAAYVSWVSAMIVDVI